MSKVARFSSQLNLFAQVLSLETTVILLCTTEVCVYMSGMLWCAEHGQILSLSLSGWLRA